MFFHLLVRIEVLVLWPHYHDILGRHLSLSGAVQSAAATASGTDKTCLRMYDWHSSGGFSIYIQYVPRLDASLCIKELTLSSLHSMLIAQ